MTGNWSTMGTDSSGLTPLYIYLVLAHLYPCVPCNLSYDFCQVPTSTNENKTFYLEGIRTTSIVAIRIEKKYKQASC